MRVELKKKDGKKRVYDNVLGCASNDTEISIMLEDETQIVLRKEEHLAIDDNLNETYISMTTSVQDTF